jgi:hypothetical protein
MARLLTSGFELKDNPTTDIFAPDGHSVGTAATVADTTEQRSGNACAKCQGTATATSLRRLVPSAGTPEMFGRHYFKVSALPASTVRIARTSLTTGLSVRLTAAGKVQLWQDAGGQIGSDSVEVIGLNRWYRLELRCDVTAANPSAELRLATDETLPPDYPAVTVASASGLSPAPSAWGIYEIGWLDAPGVTASMWLDDVALNTTSGTAQNSWPGAGNVAYLPATAIVAKDAAGATCKGASPSNADVLTAITAIPPAGHDDSTNAAHTPHHFKSTSSTNPTTVLEVDCQSYAAGGVPADASISAVFATACHAEGVGAGTKTGNLSMTANPVIANKAVTYGADVGAAGAYSTNWRWTSTDAADHPNVDRSTAPRAKITKTDATTRSAMVCALGVVVEYTAPESPG